MPTKIYQIYYLFCLWNNLCPIFILFLYKPFSKNLMLIFIKNHYFLSNRRGSSSFCLMRIIEHFFSWTASSIIQKTFSKNTNQSAFTRVHISHNANSYIIILFYLIWKIANWIFSHIINSCKLKNIKSFINLLFLLSSFILLSECSFS